MDQAREDRVTASPRVPRSPGRPRNPMAERRILDAAIDEYLACGSGGFTMDGVARRAGIGKSTLYLRWPNKDALLVDSVLARSGSIEDVDTGSLRGDLVELTGNLARFLLEPLGFATFRITVESVATRSHQRVATQLAERHRAAAVHVFDRARRRGEVFDDAAVATVVRCLYGAVAMEVLAHGLSETGPPPGTDLAESCAAIVDLLLPMLRP